MEWIVVVGKAGAIVSVTVAVALVLRYVSMRPSHQRTWVSDNKYHAYPEFHGDEVTIYKVRDFNWRSTRDYDEHWTDMTFRLEDVDKLWLTLEYFSPAFKFMAHTIFTFEFKDGRRIACSIEVRRIEGKKYGPIKGLFRNYELLYVWATERDVIGVRTHCRKHSVTHLLEAEVFVPGNERRMFESYLRRTNKLLDDPEWYNTATNTCSSNIVDHVNEVFPGRIPWGYYVLMPGLSPKFLCRNRLIKFRGTVEETLERSRIDQRAKDWDGETDFGDWIRFIEPAQTAGDAPEGVAGE